MRSSAYLHRATRAPQLRELPNRARVVYIILTVMAIALICRGVYLQSFQRQFLQKKGEMRYSRVITIPASRGRILDRHGQVLAVSTSVKSIWAIPSDVEMSSKERLRVASLLRMDTSEIKKKLSESDRDFVYIKRQVPPDVAQQVLALDIPGVYETDAQARYYPRGEELANLIGWTDVDDRGREGVELSCDAALEGASGSRRVIKDRRGQIIEDVASVKSPQQGHNIELTIDSRLQFIAYRELKKAVELNKAKAGELVMLDAHTGELLAAVNWPTFNPNNRIHLNRSAVRSRAFTDEFEPGSTMKPFAISMALESGKYHPNTLIPTGKGVFVVEGATIHDAHPSGTITVSQVIQRSSNVGAAKIVLSLPSESLYKFLSSVGFGHTPNIGFPGEAPGRLRPVKTWRPIEHATMAYGHGISVSLIQLAQAYTIFANDGRLLPVKMYMDGFSPSEFMHPDKAKKRVPVSVMSPTTAHEMLKMLESVTQPGGTALKARIIGYSVAGKTGTAHKLLKHRYVDKYRASFVGMAPASNPRLIVAVMIDEPNAGEYYGGTVAAPVFSEVVGQSLRILGVMPDLTALPSKESESAETIRESD